jgi:hypothetical protein
MSSPGLVPLASRPAHDTSPGTHEGVPSLTTTTWHRVWMLPRQQTYAVRRGMFSISYLVVVSVRHHPDTPMVSYLYLAEKLEHPCA